MRKIIKLLFIITMVIPFIAKADMGAPGIAEYDAIIIKEEGADIYTWDSTLQEYKVTNHLDKGTKVRVIWEDSEKNLVLIEIDGNYDSHIKPDTIAPAKEEIVPSDLPDSTVNKNNIQLYINDPNGVDIKKGPADIYGVAGHIEYGVTIKPSYQDDSSGRHYYIDYNGVKGWIMTLEDKVVLVNNDYYFINTPIKLNTETIPRLELIKPVYCTDVWGIGEERQLCEFSYKNDKKYISVFKSDDIFYVGNPTTEMEEIRFKKDVTIKSTDNTSNKEFKINKGDFAYFLNSNPAYGDHANLIIDLYKDGTLISYKGVYDYGNYEDFEKTGKKIKFNSILNELSKPEETTKTTTTTEFTTTMEPTMEEIKQDKPNSTKDIIIISSIVGGVVALTAIVIIVLINKKKKKNILAEVNTTIEPINQPVESIVSTEQVEQTINDKREELIEQDNIIDVTNEFKEEDNNEKDN